MNLVVVICGGGDDGVGGGAAAALLSLLLLLLLFLNTVSNRFRTWEAAYAQVRMRIIVSRTRRSKHSRICHMN